MTIRRLIGAIAGATFVLFAGGAGAGDKKSEVGGYDLAITIDDLPTHGALPPGMTRSEIARMTLDAYKAHKVPRVYGFINAVGLEREPGSIEVLKAWRAAGHPLGNHTSTHGNIDNTTVEGYIDTIKANEPVLKELMAGDDWHYFRYPFLNSGDAAHHDPVVKWLSDNGYKIADTSMSFNDWAYTDTYARCVAKGDAATIEAMKVRYMEEVRTLIARSKTLSQKVYGRMIPQVLLTHIGGFGAIMLPDVLAELEKSGARFVTLDKAQSDPAYGQPGPNSGAGLIMERTAAEKGIDTSAILNVSVAGLDQLCR